MSELFRKVLCSERLPDKTGVYFVEGKTIPLQELYFEPDLPLLRNAWRDEGTYWLEPVILPSEDQIGSIANKLFAAGCEERENRAYRAGFKKALEIINGK